MPKVGPFYWFPSLSAETPSWKLVAAHDFGLDGDTGHVELWPYILMRLAAAWSKDAASTKRRLGLAYTGLPRGRVTKPEKAYLILHGNDAPVPGWEKMVIECFQLSRRKVKIVFDEHETHIPGHPEAFDAHFNRVRSMKLGR